jgi:hypothetical protein
MLFLSCPEKNLGEQKRQGMPPGPRLEQNSLRLPEFGCGDSLHRLSDLLHVSYAPYSSSDIDEDWHWILFFYLFFEFEVKLLQG